MSFLDKITNTIFGNKHEKEVKGLQPTVDKINEICADLASLSNDELRGKSVYFREQIADYLADIDTDIEGINQQVNDPEVDDDTKEELYQDLDKLKDKRDEKLEEVLQELLPEAFAVMKETARRFTENAQLEATATELDRELAVNHPNIEIHGDKVVYHNKWKAMGMDVEWNMIHYDVQLVGGMVLHNGKIAEMKTGEGKTLVSTLPSYLNGLTGQGVHLVTVNDYLAKRDSEWNAPLFYFLGLTVDCIDKYKPNSEERRKAYRADITYGTNNEFGFDYLRDNMVRTPQELVQRKHHFAMVDEVDSVLIDDARTPLIISGPIESSDEKEFYELKPRIQRLVEAQKKVFNQFLTEAKTKIADGNTGQEEGGGGLALLRAQRALPRTKSIIKYLSEPGVKQILQKTENFYMQNNNEKMPEADKELYFVIEEKTNQVDLTDKGIDLITGAGEDPQFFVMPDVGSEIAEIENSDADKEEKLQKKDKLMQEFAVKSERIHSVNQLLKAYALFERDEEYIVVDGKVKIVDENTGRVMEGRRYSDGLHQAIEAKENVKVEGATQTWATITLQNYFRMYHKLAGMTGTAETEASEFWDIYELDVTVIPTNRPIQRDDKNDLIYKTKREKFNAIIEEVQELTAAGRPVLVGTTSVEVSELLSRMLDRSKIKHNVLNAKQHAREADIVAEAGKPGAVTIATNMAGRGTDIKINDAVKEAGGLAIIGSERHDSRRVDNQLRGRAGRQGDPGSSQFFVSMEDNLMRLFISESIAKVMDRFGYKEGEVIQHSMITKNIERAQKKVEENNFGIRKRLLEYDDVMNNQRTAIYDKRRHALHGERLGVDIAGMFFDLCLEIINENQAARDFDGLKLDVIRFFSVDTEITENELMTKNADKLAEKLYLEVREAYKRKVEQLTRMAYPILQKLHEERGETVKRVAMPVTDGKKGMNVTMDLQEVMESEGRAIRTAFEKSILMALIDEHWKQQLRRMDDLKQEVQTAAYEQKDPLLIYKLEAYEVFKTMVSELNRDVTAFLFKASLPVRNPNEVKEDQQPKQSNLDRLKAGRDDANSVVQPGAGPQAQQRPEPQKAEPVRVEKKVGRNEPCPCGSGKKYKHCHGKA